MQVQGAFNLLFRPGLRKDFRDNYQPYPTEYSMFLKTGSIDGPEIEATIMTGLNRLVERGDGEPITYFDPKMGPKVIGVDKEFAAGFMITRRTVEDDKYGKANQGAKWLAHAARMTQEYRAAELLDDAFDGNVYKGIDNLPLCSTAHTLINSSLTISNELDPPIQVSLTGYNAMLDLWMQMKDENGDPVIMEPDRLIIGNHSTDLNTALAIQRSALEPFTADNTDNVMRQRLGGAAKPMISHFKSSRRSWFMFNQRWNDAHFLTRRPVEFDDTFDFETDAAKYKTTTRFLIWFVDWRPWCGSDAT
jgi:hypothetical protein